MINVNHKNKYQKLKIKNIFSKEFEDNENGSTQIEIYIYIYFNVEITSAVFTLFWFEPTSTPNFKEIKIFN